VTTIVSTMRCKTMPCETCGIAMLRFTYDEDAGALVGLAALDSYGVPVPVTPEVADAIVEEIFGGTHLSSDIKHDIAKRLYAPPMIAA
jgi:hypothetical protein